MSATTLPALLVGSMTFVQGEGFVSSLSPGFRDVRVAGEWNEPVCVVVRPDGSLYVVERRGVVWRVVDGRKQEIPFLDISEEVNGGFGKGMKGFVLDPDYETNGYVYAFYEVDRHHLLHFGTPAYDSNADDLANPTIARITRFIAVQSDGRLGVDPATRKVLLGESPSTGFPVVDYDHNSGTLVFGRDGSLLAGCGDSAQAVADDGGTPSASVALEQGFLRPAENVGAFRSQLLNCLNGKIVRIDPETGDGLPSNPFFDSRHPRAPASRVWALGLRNPFRFSVLPASVAEAAPKAHPGVLVIADIGLSSFEELNFCTTGGQNFGWPIYEGMGRAPGYFVLPTQNLDAPRCGATNEFCSFQDGLRDEILGASPVPGLESTPSFVHTWPLLDWGRSGPARTAVRDASGSRRIVRIDETRAWPAAHGEGDVPRYALSAGGRPPIAPPVDPPPRRPRPAASPSSPLEERRDPVCSLGESFGGAGAIAGTWYGQGSFPPEFRDSFFFTDYTGGWIRCLKFDATGHLRQVLYFGAINVGILSMAADPTNGDLLYCLIGTNGQGEVRRISFDPDNLAPVAVIRAEPREIGNARVVQFDAGDSTDEHTGTLRYLWDFGDGTPPSTCARPVHVFPSIDVTREGIPDALILNLDPPQETSGSGLETMRDGEFPPFPDTTQQCFTRYDPPAAKNGSDWVGYRFRDARQFHGLVYQEGTHFKRAGGWFESVSVDVFVDGSWVEVQGVAFDPPYARQRDDLSRSYFIQFPPVLGRGIRLRGKPGGPLELVSICELRVLAHPSPSADLPQKYSVTLTVTDDANARDHAVVPVWTGMR